MAVTKHPSALVACLWGIMPKAWATKSVLRAPEQEKYLDQTGSSLSSSPAPCNFPKCRVLLSPTPARALGSSWVLTEERKYVQRYASVIQSCLWGFAANGMPELEKKFHAVLFQVFVAGHFLNLCRLSPQEDIMDALHSPATHCAWLISFCLFWICFWWLHLLSLGSGGVIRLPALLRVVTIQNVRLEFCVWSPYPPLVTEQLFFLQWFLFFLHITINWMILWFL